MFEILIPSKCFVFGEYVAMAGGPALVYSGPPLFKIQIAEAQSEAESLNLPAYLASQSPAGKWLKKKGSSLGHWQVETPYSQGGLGRSSAEFLALYLFLKHNVCSKTSTWTLPLTPSEAWTMWEDFQSLYQEKHFETQALKKNKSLSPSGYDVLAQSQKGFILIESAAKRLQLFSQWPFKDLWIGFFPVGVKQPTHEHLKQLPWINHHGDGFIPGRLQVLAAHLAEAFLERKQDHFIESLREFRHELQVWGLESKLTSEWIDRIQHLKGFVVAKGCGALGADFVMVVVEKAYLEPFWQGLKKRQKEFENWAHPPPGPICV